MIETALFVFLAAGVGVAAAAGIIALSIYLDGRR